MQNKDAVRKTCYKIIKKSKKLALFILTELIKEEKGITVDETPTKNRKKSKRNNHQINELNLGTMIIKRQKAALNKEIND